MGEVLGAALAIVLPLVTGLLVGNQGWKKRFDYLEKSVAIRDSMDSEKDEPAIEAMNELIKDQARVLRDQVPLRREPTWLLAGLPPALGGAAFMIYSLASPDGNFATSLGGTIAYIFGMAFLGVWLGRPLRPPAK